MTSNSAAVFLMAVTTAFLCPLINAAGYSDPNTPATPLPRFESESLTVDGIMDEVVWDQAAAFSGFFQFLPVDGRPAEDSTIVQVWYSPTHMYFGIKAYEVHDEVRATLADRDKIDDDDYIYLVLDTYNDQRQGILVGVNPLGQQADGIISDSEGGRQFNRGNGVFDIDLSPDFVYESKGTVTEYGYDVEIKIPFKSLRYQSSYVQDWGFNVIRKIQHSGYVTTWTQVLQGNASFMAQNGSLVDLTDLRRGLVLDISPEITGTTNRIERNSDWNFDARDPLGVNVRWGVSNNFTLNGTINPDFSQVEADVAQIQFDPRSAVFVPEKRPFFLDGIELFQSPTRLIYTRSVSNPLSAAKVTGKAGNTSVAFLSAVDNKELHLADLDARYFNAVRLRRDLTGQNTLGLTYTDKVDGNHWNRVAAVDGRFVFSKLYSVTYQSGFSITGDPGVTTTAPMWRLVANAAGRKYGGSFTSRGFHGNFNAETGFITRVGIVQKVLDGHITWLGDEGDTVESFRAGISLDGTWDYDRFTAGNGPNDRKLHWNTSYNFRGGWSGGTSIFYESFKYPEELYTNYYIQLHGNGVPIDTVSYTGTDRLTNLGAWTFLGTPQLNNFSGSLFFVAGRDDNFFEWASADIYFLTLNLNWNPTDKLRFNLLYNHQQYVRANDKSIVGMRRVPRLKVEYQLTSALFFRLVGQYDSNFIDELRDNSRTEDPILVLDDETGEYNQTSVVRSNNFRVDWLVSYRPNPGTVLFLGYGSSLSEPHTYRFRDLRRQSDGFFLKLSYLFRV